MQEACIRALELGMAIVKGLIDKMGGSIEIKSEEGVGSSFIIRIPFKIASAPIRVKEQKNRSNHRKPEFTACRRQRIERRDRRNAFVR